MPPKVAVLVLNFNSYSDTLGCVACIKQADYSNIHLIVLDNASPDHSGHRLATVLSDNEFIQLPKNAGYAGGNNVGMRRAMEVGADYIFILNPDVRLGKHTISECVNAALHDPRLGAVNPIQVRDDKGTIDAKFLRSVLKPAGIQQTCYGDDMVAECLEVRDLLGAALFVTVRAIERVGGFDPLYFAYGEETDLCRRLRYHGFRLGVTGKDPVKHLRTKETAGVSDRVLFLRLKGMYLGELKNPRRSFRRSLRVVSKQFADEMLGRRRGVYPFNQYPVTRWHSVRAFAWVVGHLAAIRRHRRLEIAGRAHV